MLLAQERSCSSQECRRLAKLLLFCEAPIIMDFRSLIYLRGEPVVIGLILRSHLLVLLQAKVDFQHTPTPGDTRDRINSRYDVRDFAKPVSSKGISIYEIDISPQEMDLQLFVNPTPYIVPEDMSLTKVYNLFRQLGLRHICVVPSPSQVVGVITRKDLLPEVLDRDNLDETLSNRGRLGPEA